MKLSAPTVSSGKLYFKDLHNSGSVIEVIAELYNGNEIKFNEQRLDNMLQVFVSKAFRISDERFSSSNQFYVGKVSEVFVQEMKINEIKIAFISGIFEISENGIGMIESFKMHGYFSKIKVEQW